MLGRPHGLIVAAQFSRIWVVIGRSLAGLYTNYLLDALYKGHITDCLGNGAVLLKVAVSSACSHLGNCVGELFARVVGFVLRSVGISFRCLEFFIALDYMVAFFLLFSRVKLILSRSYRIGGSSIGVSLKRVVLSLMIQQAFVNKRFGKSGIVKSSGSVDMGSLIELR